MFFSFNLRFLSNTESAHLFSSTVTGYINTQYWHYSLSFAIHRKRKHNDRSYPTKFEFILSYRQASGFGFFPWHSVLIWPSTLVVWRQYQWIWHRYKSQLIA